ncbi:MAG: hypothetical protein FJ264_05580 [Planctomycetes bacterium]|nr:hypothetical protein [Planctomycetota bacterium]
MVNDNRDQTKQPEETYVVSSGEPSSGNRDKFITPLKITADEKKVIHSAVKKNVVLKRAMLASGIIGVIVAVFWLFMYLSQKPAPSVTASQEKRMPDGASQEQTSAVPVSKPDTGKKNVRSTEQKNTAVQKLSGYLLLKKELDKKGASEWGGELYEEAIRFSKIADDSFIRKEFDGASENYAAATALLTEMNDGINDALSRVLDEGQQALVEGNGALAQKRFQVALMIDPENGFARQNLERAKNIEKVMAFIASGEKHEKNNELSAAYDKYQEAANLDPECVEAQAALKRVEKLIADEMFQQLMSEGFLALNGNNYEDARTFFLKAGSLKPGSHEAKDALTQAEIAIRLAHIEELKKKALAAEESEDWEGALSSYQEILNVDGAIQFAIQGKERTAQRSELEKLMRQYLETPGLLESDQNIEKATKLMYEAKQIEPKSLRFKQLLKEFDELITLVQTPAPVIIESDGMTEVIVYKVGKLGLFNTREMKLRPGKYTIVGARDGYKDVRLNILVKPEQEPIRITVKCTEKI